MAGFICVDGGMAGWHHLGGRRIAILVFGRVKVGRVARGRSGSCWQRQRVALRGSTLVVTWEGHSPD